MTIPIAVRKYDVDGFERFVLAMIQLQPGGDDKAANLPHMQDMVRRASQGQSSEGLKPQLIMLPEMFNAPITSAGHKRHAELVPNWTGGAIEPDELSPLADSPTCHALSQVAREVSTYLIGGSIPERDPDGGDKIWNCVTVWDPQGRMIGKYRKLHLYDVDIPGGITHFESEVISPGDGTLTLKLPFGTIGIAVCYDIRFANLIMAMRDANPEICAYLLPAAFNTVTGPKAWEVLQRVRAIDNQIFVGMCSPARDPSVEYVAYGHSLVSNPEGKIISTPTPEDESESIVYATLDPQNLIRVRQGLPVFASQRKDVYQAPSLKAR